MAKAVITQLSKVLADSYSLALKTQNYHWNVQGPNFPHYHAMFEAQYTELFVAIDEIAERIRALDAKAPGSYQEFAKLTVINPGNAEFNDTEMVEDLLASHQLVIATLEKAVAAAEKAADQGTVDLLSGRVSAHEKTRWMLKSTLPVTKKRARK